QDSNLDSAGQSRVSYRWTSQAWWGVQESNLGGRSRDDGSTVRPGIRAGLPPRLASGPRIPKARRAACQRPLGESNGGSDVTKVPRPGSDGDGRGRTQTQAANSRPRRWRGDSYGASSASWGPCCFYERAGRSIYRRAQKEFGPTARTVCSNALRDSQ